MGKKGLCLVQQIFMEQFLHARTCARQCGYPNIPDLKMLRKSISGNFQHDLMTAKSEISPGDLGKTEESSLENRGVLQSRKDQGRLPGGGGTKESYKMNKMYPDGEKMGMGKQLKRNFKQEKELGQRQGNRQITWNETQQREGRSHRKVRNYSSIQFEARSHEDETGKTSKSQALRSMDFTIRAVRIAGKFKPRR